MRSTRIIAVVALVLLSGSSVFAFDGKRQGFVVGGGIGFCPYNRISPEIQGDEEGGLALHGLIGYAQNEHNLLALEGNISTRLFDGQSYLGPTWYRYFGREGRTFFSAVGLGIYHYSADGFFREPEDHEAGFGYMIGVGFEFAEHLQFAAYFTGGKTYHGDVDYSMDHLNIVFSYLAF